MVLLFRYTIPEIKDSVGQSIRRLFEIVDQRSQESLHVFGIDYFRADSVRSAYTTVPGSLYWQRIIELAKIFTIQLGIIKEELTIRGSNHGGERRFVETWCSV